MDYSLHFFFTFLSRHKGEVTGVVEGTSNLHVTYEDGKVSILELRKQGVRFVPQKQKRSKTWTQVIQPLGSFYVESFYSLTWRLFIFEASLVKFIFLATQIAAGFWVSILYWSNFSFLRRINCIPPKPFSELQDLYCILEFFFLLLFFYMYPISQSRFLPVMHRSPLL